MTLEHKHLIIRANINKPPTLSSTNLFTLHEGSKIEIHTPLIGLTKAQIILEGLKNKVDFEMTVSCYQASKSFPNFLPVRESSPM